MKDKLGLGLAPGSSHYRAYVGPPEDYDLVAAMCFGLLTSLGLRGHHNLLDIGCGSCRLGRLLIPYLNENKYYGMEPHKWLVESGVENEMGDDLVRIKNPSFIFTDNISDITEREYFHFAIAQSIFSHCGQDLLNKHLADISSVLTSNGALLATFIEGENDSQEKGWIYPGCVAFKKQSMENIAQSHGLKFYMLDWLHPRQSWALFSKPGFDISWLIGRPLGWNSWLLSGQK